MMQGHIELQDKQRLSKVPISLTNMSSPNHSPRKISNFPEMRKLLCRDAIDTTDASDTLASVAENPGPRLTGWTTLTFGSQSRWKAQESNETVKKAVPWAFLTLPKNWKNARGKHARKQ